MKTAKNAYYFLAYDFSEEPQVNTYGIRFKTEEEFKSFKEIFDKAKQENGKLKWETKEADKETEEKKEDDKKVEEKKEEKKE